MIIWTRQSRGWHTAEDDGVDVGGACLEDKRTAPDNRGAGWYFYPAGRPNAEALGPYLTLGALKWTVERRTKTVGARPEGRAK